MMTETLTSENRPEAPFGSPKDTILVCDRCRRQILRVLPGHGYWCYTCGDRPVAPVLVYDRRR